MNDYSNFGSNFAQQAETLQAAAKTSKNFGLVFFAATAAGVAYVATRPRVRRAIKELMTPEPENATVTVAAE